MKRVLVMIMSSYLITSAYGMSGEHFKEDLYKVLGISEDATSSEIKKAYYELARKYHPDKSKDTSCSDKMKLINAAYTVLSDAKKRKEYDIDKVFGFSVEDMVDDVMDDFGVDRYDESKDEDYVQKMSEDSCGSSDEESYDSDSDSFDEDLYQSDGAHLHQKWKSHYKTKMEDEELIRCKIEFSKKLQSKPKTFKRLRKVVDGRITDTW